MVTVTSYPEGRVHALDGLRAAAMLLGIVLHAAASFIVTPFPWIVRDVSRSFAFDVLLGLIHGFRMPLFFLLAGFFAHLLWQRSGTRGFLVHRALRVGLPFAIGMVTIVPAILALWRWAQAHQTAARARLPHITEFTYPTAHLWFLEMLLILYALAMCIAWLGRRWDAARLDAAFDRWIASAWKPLLMVPLTVLCLWGGPMLGEPDMM